MRRHDYSKITACGIEFYVEAFSRKLFVFRSIAQTLFLVIYRVDSKFTTSTRNLDKSVYNRDVACL
ncbi:hypothetical protein [Microcoleus sp. herbarium12]|uniref:hypothetical protein n=1 Tax=Microcoleus sp. herbarium12 TaxID=3055437 RepID=UPI002FD0367F